MNKIKYGDTVIITDGERKGKIGKIGSKANYGQCTVITDDEFIIISTSDVAPYSPTPDMLAIPDDHVWPVEWKPLKPDTEKIWVVSDGNTSAFMTGCDASVPLQAGYTHYLTEADLLKLPFQQ